MPTVLRRQRSACGLLQRDRRTTRLQVVKSTGTIWLRASYDRALTLPWGCLPKGRGRGSGGKREYTSGELARTSTRIKSRTLL